MSALSAVMMYLAESASAVGALHRYRGEYLASHSQKIVEKPGGQVRVLGWSKS